MDWIKVTPETLPPVKKRLGSCFPISDELWLTVFNKRTGDKTVLRGTYTVKSEEDKHFNVEYRVVVDSYQDSWLEEGGAIPCQCHSELDEDIEVTHWAGIEYPEPAED